MATFSLRAEHQKLVDRYGSTAIGTFAQMHPLVRRVLADCRPDNTGPDSKYVEFLTLLDDHYYRHTGKHNQEEFRKLVPPQKFYELMAALATGMQFSAKKSGTHIQADNYRFQHTFTVNGCAFNGLGAAALVEGDNRLIAINPFLIFLAVTDPEKFRKNLPLETKGLDIPEVLTLIGVEEMYHLYQVQKGQSPQYRLDQFDRRKYDDDPMEKEADVLQTIAITELRLGSEYRGHRRGG